MTDNHLSLWTLGLLLTTSACANGVPSPHGEDAEAAIAPLRRDRGGAVFTVGNESTGNRTYAFARDAEGLLSDAVAYDTQGLGSGDSLGSQGALALSDDGRFLIAVNAGSNDVSSFTVDGAELAFADRISSGGTRPVSVTVRRGLVYVVNAGVPANVSGFFLDRRGRLHPIAGGSASLSADDVGPAQVELSPDARSLVVTEKATSILDRYAVGAFGRLGERTSTASAGTTPFGFEFTSRGTLIVSEAATASLSSYALRRDELRVISAVVPDTQAAPCWVAVSADDRFAFTANAGSASVSSYTVARNGEIALASARAADLGEGARPLDMALAGNGRYLYVLDRGHAEIAGFTLSEDGTLDPRAFGEDLPPFASGLAAY